MGIGTDCCGNTPLEPRLNRREVNQRTAVKPVKRNRIVAHPDHFAQIRRLNRVVGQLQGVRRMIEERRYCPDILIQTRAASSALRAMEISILETHIKHCVTDAVSAPDAVGAGKKIAELVDLVGRF